MNWNTPKETKREIGNPSWKNKRIYRSLSFWMDRWMDMDKSMDSFGQK